MRALLVIAFLISASLGPFGPALAAAPSSILHETLNLPDWLTLTLQSRIRYETLDGQFRADTRSGDQALTIQTTALAEAQWKSVRIGAEMIDARMLLDDAGSPLDTTQVDTTELLQAYVVVENKDIFANTAASVVRIGRQTLDLGSRRLVARNRFRNTINAFTGIDWKLSGAGGWTTEWFFGVPVTRLPATRQALDDNEAALDEEDFGSAFWLAAWQPKPWAGSQRLEAYMIGLHESDARFATRNRRLVTPGLRWFRDPAVDHLDFQLEVALQVGQSRATEAVTNRTDLDHFAHFETLQVGYTFRSQWSPRVAAMFDYASGDDDPADGANDRFDTLFGARRFDYGPTGIWGPFIRSNLLSPGLRLQATPLQTVRLMAGYRAFWLASRRDAWVPARLADPTGRSGRFVGNQFEFSIGWVVHPKHVALEVGGAYLDGGGFRQRVVSGGPDDESTYLYAHVLFTF